MTADFGGLRMKHLIKIIALISALCLVLGMLSGCSGSGVEAEVKNYKEITDNRSLENLANGVVAENDYFKMIWNQTKTGSDGNEYPRAAIEFVSKKDGSVWSTVPKDYYDSTDAASIFGNDLINSSIVVTVRNGEQTFAYNAYDKVIVNNTFSSVKCADKDGITVTYYFDEIGVVVGVDYYLEDDGFKIGVDPKNINSYVLTKGDEWNEEVHGASLADAAQKVVSVTPAPFVCGAQNTPQGSKDSYLVVPSGSGALMYIDKRSDSSIREFGNYQTKPETTTGLVYGEDLTVDKYNSPSNDTPITMPFYGIKRGNNALCAIIEQAAEACKITAIAGDPNLGVSMLDATPSNGYSYIAASYNVLGYNTVYSQGTWRLQYNDTVDQNITPLVIGYYPLSGNQANYTGMAKRYQKHLVDKENLKKSQDNNLLNVKLYGSFLKDELFAGIPYDDAISLTSYAEATEILGELKKISGGSLTAIMQGFGDGGIDGNTIAGGLKLTGASGNKKELKEFVEYTKSNNIKTFFNFDVIKFYESGKGYSTKTDVAINVNGVPAPVYQFLNSTRDRYERKKGGKVGALIAREKLAEVTSDAVALADELGITGIAFDTLGNICYSDYDVVETENDTNKEVYKNPWRNNMGKDVKAITADIQKNSKTVLMDGAFAYAAVAADIITNVPTASTKSNMFDVEIPLYQIVFQGYRANSTGAINTATNKRTQFLKSIETGSGLSFELIGNYYQELRKQTMTGLHAALYSDNAKVIEEYVNEGKTFLTSVAGATIVSHQYMTNDVTKTVFDNGVTVYVNFGDTDYKSDIGVVKAQGFLNK